MIEKKDVSNKKASIGRNNKDVPLFIQREKVEDSTAAYR
jgi:hypothetical protein